MPCAVMAFLTAVTFVAEPGDRAPLLRCSATLLQRVEPISVWCPLETLDRRRWVRRGGISHEAGNPRARRVAGRGELLTSRYPPASEPSVVGATERLPKITRAIASKAQVRLCALS